MRLDPLPRLVFWYFHGFPALSRRKNEGQGEVKKTTMEEMNSTCRDPSQDCCGSYNNNNLSV